MWISVAEAARNLEQRGLLERHEHDHAERTIAYVGELLGQPLPADLDAFYRARIGAVGPFSAVAPKWNSHVGWRDQEGEIKRLAQARAAPLFYDGSGNLFGLDLAAEGQTPAVYFFDHEFEFSEPGWTAGSSLGVFLLLLAEHDQALHEARPQGWELGIDADIDKCPRAPPIWRTDDAS